MEQHIELEDTQRKRGAWSRAALDYLGAVKDTLDELKPYFPLTVRQVYYQLVTRKIIENDLSQYKKLSRILVRARLDGKVPWIAIEDRARSNLTSDGWPDAKTFADEQLEVFLDGYRRDLLQNQKVALEIWVEKDALSRICHDVAFQYCVPVIVARGFSSISYVNECRRRVLANACGGKPTVILYFGDLDPSGWEMLPSMMRTLQKEMRLGHQVTGERCALTPAQVDQLRLPQSLDAVKDRDPRTPKFKQMLRRQGYPETLAVELDAVPPAVLETIVRQAIEKHLHRPLFRSQRRIEGEERDALQQLRGRVVPLVPIDSLDQRGQRG